MKAKIFLLDGQDDLATMISSLLVDAIHKGIEVQRYTMDRYYSRSSKPVFHERCRDYLQCLRASLLTSDPFAIVAKNNRETQWCYMGYGYENFGQARGYCFELRQIEMTALFPAVAIGDRIVMLPEEFHTRLHSHPREFLSLAKPLGLGGMELVDFSCEEAIRHAVYRVAQQMKREWKSYCHRHMAIRCLRKPDLVELARLLKENSDILRSCELFSPDVDLHAEIAEGQAVEGVLSRVVLEISNKGGRALREVRIRVRAPSGVLASPVLQIRDLLPPETLKIELQMVATTPPCCPLEVSVDLGHDPVNMPTFPIPVHVPVAPSPIVVAAK